MTHKGLRNVLRCFLWSLQVTKTPVHAECCAKTATSGTHQMRNVAPNPNASNVTHVRRLTDHVLRRNLTPSTSPSIDRTCSKKWRWKTTPSQQPKQSKMKKKRRSCTCSTTSRRHNGVLCEGVHGRAHSTPKQSGSN